MNDIEWVIEHEQGKLGFNIREGYPCVHCLIDNITIDTFRLLPSMFVDFKKIMRDRGFKILFTCIPDNDKTLFKFQQRFGFVEVSRSNGQILFMQEI